MSLTLYYRYLRRYPQQALWVPVVLGLFWGAGVVCGAFGRS